MEWLFFMNIFLAWLVCSFSSWFMVSIIFLGKFCYIFIHLQFTQKAESEERDPA